MATAYNGVLRLLHACMHACAVRFGADVCLLGENTMRVQLPFLKECSHSDARYCENEEEDESLPLALEFQAQMQLFCKAVR